MDDAWCTISRIGKRTEGRDTLMKKPLNTLQNENTRRREVIGDSEGIVEVWDGTRARWQPLVDLQG